MYQSRPRPRWGTGFQPKNVTVCIFLYDFIFSDVYLLNIYFIDIRSAIKDVSRQAKAKIGG